MKLLKPTRGNGLIRPGQNAPQVIKDNRSVATKVALRRWLLAKMGLTEVRVLDTCSGLGQVWSAMEEHVTIRQWTRCDIKPRSPGVLRLDAKVAIERFPLAVYNVIDVDPYADPWECYQAVLNRLTTRTAVFLTCGHGRILSDSTLDVLGVPPDWRAWAGGHLPVMDPMFMSKRCLNVLTWGSGVKVIEAGAVTSMKHSGASGAYYYALGLDPA